VYQSEAYEKNMEMDINVNLKNKNTYVPLDFDKAKFKKNLDCLLMKGVEKRTRMEEERKQKEKLMN
jgi:hypothetical protein